MDIHDKDTCLAGNSGAANADIKIEVRDKAANAIAKAGADKDNDIADDGISIVDNSENAKNHHFVGDSEVKQLMRELEAACMARFNADEMALLKSAIPASRTLYTRLPLQRCFLIWAWTRTL